MKNVAATRGQRVSFVAFLFALEIVREDKWAGTDMLLNFYSRPPRAIWLFAGLPRPCFERRGADSQRQNTSFARWCNKKMQARRNFFVRG
jgi:hypothetical protein